MSTATQPVQTAAPNPFALQKKPQPKNVMELLQNDAFKQEIAKVLPKHMNAERMLRVALTTTKMNDKLQQVTMQSFAGAMLKCSQYGLEPDGRHAHLIPYRNKDGGYDLNLIFDYKGLVSLVRRSGEVSDINADVVYNDDEFICEKGSDAKLLHRSNYKSANRTPENIYAIYSFVKLKDGTPSFDVMTIDEVNRIRDRSQGYIAAKKYGKDSVWDTDWNEMAKKTVFRRHTKWLPISAEVKEAIHGDDDRLSDDERFHRAKPVEAQIVSPDFTLPSTPATPAPVQAEQEPAEQMAATVETPAPPVPNATLGEKPKRPKAEPKTPAPGTREAFLIELRDLMQTDAVDEKDVLKVLYKLQMLPEGTRLESAPSDLLKDLLTQSRWSAIVAETAML